MRAAADAFAAAAALGAADAADAWLAPGRARRGCAAHR